MESLDTCIGELQQQAYAQRLELQDVHHLEEELAVKEKAIRDTQMSRTMHELGEMKRAQELRVHEEFIEEFINLRHQVLQVTFPCSQAQVHLLQERKNELETQSQCRHLQAGRQP